MTIQQFLFESAKLRDLFPVESVAQHSERLIVPRSVPADASHLEPSLHRSVSQTRSNLLLREPYSELPPRLAGPARALSELARRHPATCEGPPAALQVPQATDPRQTP